MYEYLKKIVLGVGVISLCAMISLASAAFDIRDGMSSSAIGNDSRHKIDLYIISTSTLTNGSLKINFDDSFDFSGMLPSDVSISGGDVVWGVPSMDLLNDIILFPFVGDLNNTDGLLEVTVGSVNYVNNPIVEGMYEIVLTTHAAADGSGAFMEYKDMIVSINRNIVVSATVPQALVFNVAGLVVGENVNGETTNIATDGSNVNFGTLLGAGERIGGQELTVSTNATGGYAVTMVYDHALRSGVYSISDWTGTNASPTSWSAPTGTPNGYFGYTTDDASLENLAIDRFITNKWAGSWGSPLEVMYHDGPSDGATQNSGKARVGFRVQVTDFQETGNYQSTVTYVCTPTF